MENPQDKKGHKTTVWPCIYLLYLCPSQDTTDERIELVFGMRASSHLSYTVLKGKSEGISKNMGTSFWNFVPDSGLQKIFLRHRSSKVLSTYWQLDKVDAGSVINWTVVSQLS